MPVAVLIAVYLLATLSAAGRADEQAALTSARLFTEYLRACRDERFAMSLLPPGRFLMPGNLAGSPAGDRPRRAKGTEHLDLVEATRQRRIATRRKGTALRQRLALQHAAQRPRWLASGHVDPRYGPDQALGIGMLRRADERFRRRVLHDPAEIHDDDAVGDVFDDGEVMRNEQIRETVIALQVDQQVDHLGLDRDIQRRDRLVGHHQLGAKHQCARDRDPLALSSGKHMRIAIVVLGP